LNVHKTHDLKINLNLNLKIIPTITSHQSPHHTPAAKGIKPNRNLNLTTHPPPHVSTPTAAKGIKPKVELYKLSDINNAAKRVASGKVRLGSPLGGVGWCRLASVGRFRRDFACHVEAIGRAPS
jgi:hypothetical protein